MTIARRDFLVLLGSLPIVPGVSGAANAALTAAPDAADDADIPPARTLTTLFHYTASVPAVMAGARMVDVWIPIPSSDAFQTIAGLSVSTPYPYQMTQDSQFGNRMAHLQVDSTKTPFIVDISFVAVRKPVHLLDAERGHAGKAATPTVSSGLAARALRRDALVPTGGKYRAMAQAVVGDATDKSAQMRALYDHVVKKMQYDYNHESPERGKGDVAFVCDFKKGNCTDLHSYLIAMARSLDIPCYLEFGFPVADIPFADSPKTSGDIDGYHCWVWFRYPVHGWLPLDAADGRRWADAYHPAVTGYLYGNLVTERSAVAFSRGRDITLEPAQKSDPLNYFIYPYAEAGGAPVTVGWKVHYTLPSARTAASTPNAEKKI